MDAIQDPEVRRLVEQDAVCNPSGLCVSPRDLRTGARMIPEDPAFLGVLANEPRDASGEVPGAAPLKIPSAAPGLAAGPFLPNATIGREDGDDIREVVQGVPSDRALARYSSALRGREGAVPLVALTRLVPGEEVTVCYDSGEPEGYDREAARYVRPVCC